MKTSMMISATALLALGATATLARGWDDDFNAREPAMKQPGHYEWTWDGADTLSLHAPAVMHYTPGGSPRIVITGPQELLDHIQVGQGRIRLEQEWGWSGGWHYSGHERLQVTVTGVKVHNIDVGGSGRAELEKLDTDHLSLAVSGSGSMTGEGRSEQLRLSVSGSGHADMTRLAAHDTDINLSGSGSLSTGNGIQRLGLRISGSGHADIGQLQAREARIEMSGSGRLAGSGSSDRVMINMSGNGNAELAQLRTRDADIRISGNGRIALTPREEADISVSGSGLVTMAARPAHLSQTIHGAGRVRIESP